MFRELSTILLSIFLSAPKLNPLQAHRYAETIQNQSALIDEDPLLFTAIISHESNFNERARSVDGLDLGLMQIRVAHFGNQTSWLLDGANNIKAGAHLLKMDKDFCTKQLKREPTLQEYLSVYTGSYPSCKPNDLTKQFEDYKNCITAEVAAVEDGNMSREAPSRCRTMVFKPVCRYGGKVVNCR